MTEPTRSTEPTEPTDPTGLSALVALDRIAVEEAVRLVGLVGADDWGRDTPCAGWSIRRLVAHMTAQHRGFAAAARGRGEDPEAWREAEAGAAAHRDAALDVLAAFAEPALAKREFTLPELRPGPGPGGGWPARIAVGFHLVDYAVHAWDVAAALGAPVELPEPVAAAALKVALRVPTGADARGPGAAFAPSAAVPPDASALDRTLAVLGRDPRRWPAGKPQTKL
ncbi:TIGR03086 family metal-binding protein [Streptomyces sp. NPDC052225]|uniref:TIGR03086 family metal-binding protein n=1 Tax=Streptomyces sp. NPDC052225 TaxID=3154949 RepID=UPI003433D3E2